MATRPILKPRRSPDSSAPMSATLQSIRPPHSPHVHFPPTPTLTSTHTTHSPFNYDRAPIIVSPNECALPERGGRFYSPKSSPVYVHRTPPKGCYFHPRAFEACEREVLDERFAPLNPPALIPDLSLSSSSEASDDSDMYNCSPEQSSIFMISPNAHYSTYPLSQSHSQEELNTVLAFLPYTPSPTKGRRHVKKQGTKDCFRLVTNELSIEGCLGGF
jgi:hypothetical protein